MWYYSFMDLTIGILSFNTKELTLRCLRTIEKYTKNLKYEIIVVDNGSKDGSVSAIKKEFPEIELIVNKKNRFFAAGYNQIIKVANGEYFMMLNSDTRLENNAFKRMLDFMKKNKTSACEGLEIKPDGKLISTGSHFRNPLSDFYELSLLGRMFRNEKYIRKIRMKNYSRKKTFQVDVGCNAYMCINTDLLKKIGGYDENFRLYYTEDDLSQRITKEGFSIFHYGDSYVIHEDAKSTIQLGWRRIYLFYKDMYYYHSKYSNKYCASVLYYLLIFEFIILRFRSLIKARIFTR